MTKRNRRQEAAEQIRKIMAEIKTDELSVGSLSTSDFSDFDSSDNKIDFSDDGLSMISDVSSVASFHIPKPKGKRKPQTKRQSRIPVPVKTKVPPVQSQKQSEGFKLAKPIKCPSPPPMQQPTNFLAPNLSDYPNVTICIFEGTDFPRSRFGERSTYVVVHLHPQLPAIKSPICFNRTNDAIYNGGFSLNCIGIDFSSVVPVIEVFDFISEDQSELIGLGYIQYHLARRVDDVCIVLQDEWVSIVTINTRIHCGRVKMSLIFHDQDRDVTDLVRKEHSKSISAQSTSTTTATITNGRKPTQIAEEKPTVAMESMAVQAEVEPSYQKVDCDDAIGELTLTFSSPMQPWKPPPVNIEFTRPKQTLVKPPIRPTIQFVDENALDEEDEVVVRCRPASPPPTSEPRNISPPKAIPKLYQAKVPMKPEVRKQIPEPEKEQVETEETPMRKRFARYSDFNWY